MGAWDRSQGLRMRWSKREKDLLVEYPNKPDGHMLYGFFDFIRPQPPLHMPGMEMKTLVEELEARGYDITTLRFSIKKKRPAGESR